MTGTDVETPGAHRLISLSCLAPRDARHVLNTVWLIGSDVITDLSTIAGSVSFDTQGRSSTLRLHAIYSNASGVYTCYQVCQSWATQGWFLSMGQKRVPVIPPENYNTIHHWRKAARILFMRGPLTAVQGTAVTFHCHAQRAFDFLPIWQHPANGTVRERHGPRLTSDPKLGQLVINPVHSTDAGTYTCQAQNEYGSHLTVFDLNVVGGNTFVVAYIIEVDMEHGRGY